MTKCVHFTVGVWDRKPGRCGDSATIWEDMHTIIVGYFAWQLFHSLATKSDKQIIHGRKFSLLHVTSKHLVTRVTDRLKKSWQLNCVWVATTFITTYGQQLSGKNSCVNMRPGTRRACCSYICCRYFWFRVSGGSSWWQTLSTHSSQEPVVCRL